MSPRVTLALNRCCGSQSSSAIPVRPQFASFPGAFALPVFRHLDGGRSGQLIESCEHPRPVVKSLPPSHSKANRSWQVRQHAQQVRSGTARIATQQRSGIPDVRADSPINPVHRRENAADGLRQRVGIAVVHNAVHNLTAPPHLPNSRVIRSHVGRERHHCQCRHHNPGRRATVRRFAIHPRQSHSECSRGAACSAGDLQNC